MPPQIMPGAHHYYCSYYVIVTWFWFLAYVFLILLLDAELHEVWKASYSYPSGSLVSGVFGCVFGLVTQSCLTLCDPMDCSLPVFIVHGILQARIIAWLCPSPGDLPNPGIEPASLKSPALAGRLFITRATWEAPSTWYRLATQ